MRIIQEFKDFAVRGNVLDLAVGVIIGGAFGKIVSSAVSDLLMPPLGLLLGGVNFTEIKLPLKAAGVDAAGKAVPAVTLNLGNFLQAVVDFTVIAFAVFLIVRAVNAVYRRQEAAVPAPGPSEEVKLLSEIRDLLGKR